MSGVHRPPPITDQLACNLVVGMGHKSYGALDFRGLAPNWRVEKNSVLKGINTSYFARGSSITYIQKQKLTNHIIA
jgi:hypothetical protein